LIRLTGGLAVVVAAFWITREIVNYLSAPKDPSANTIYVMAATYGENCQSFVPRSGRVNLVKAGNATAAVTRACDNSKVICMFNVDVLKLGDPADGCGKDFIASWQCGVDRRVHQVYLPAEASGSTALVSCEVR